MCRGREVWPTVGALAAVAVSLAVAPGAQAAKPVHVSCGETITADTKLANDLVDCPGNGLLIGADGVTLDLNGHTIDGDGVPVEDCPADEPCDVGIVNTAVTGGRPHAEAGYDDVTIQDGRVQQFAEGGVYVFKVNDNRLRRLVATEIGFDGFGLIRSSRVSLEDSTASKSSLGVAVGGSRDVTIERSSFTDNGGDQFSGGIFVAASERTRIVGNSVSGTADGDGVMLAFESHDNVVRGNEIFENGGGLAVNDSDRNLIEKNSIHDNTFIGAYTNGGDENRFEKNHIARNSEGSAAGIELDTSTDVGGTANRNVVLGNVLIDNDGDGIRVDPGGEHNVLERNKATGNSDDGIDLDSAATTVARNTANRNGDLGIEAVPGVTDGGGNRASGNGNPLQCVNVFCK